MSGERLQVSLGVKSIVATALGTGILAGAGIVYVLYRNQNQAQLQRIVAQINTVLQGVRDDVSNLEHEVGLLRTPTEFLSKENRSYHKRNVKKTVSFDSRSVNSSKQLPDTSTSEWSYNTAIDGTSDTASYKTAPGYESDYLSPDDEEEFYDVCSSGDESRSNFVKDDADPYSRQVSEFTWLLSEFDILSGGDSSQQKEAYDLIIEKGSMYPDNAEILWRKAKAMRDMAIMEEKQQNNQGFKDLIIEAIDYANKAIEINDTSADVHKWYAILCGMKGQFSSTKERIAGGHSFKKHIDIALKISPNDAILHHLLARFSYEISSLSWIERQVASALFGEVPNGTYEESLDLFLAAEDLRTKDWKENRLYIAKCYLNLKNKDEGAKWLRSAYLTRSTNSEDELIHAEVEADMRKYSISL